MKNFFYSGLLLILIIWSCQQDEFSNPNQDPVEKGLSNANGDQFFMVANRGSATISIYDANSTEFLEEIQLPDENAQPTYLAHSIRNRAVYVGDFINSKIVIYDDQNFTIRGEIKIDEGAFHMWINEIAGQLWINNIVSKTTSVIDLTNNTVLETLTLPFEEIPELTTDAVQHDVVLSTNGKRAFVTILDGLQTSYLVTYDTSTLKYLEHHIVGGDAHVYSAPGRLYVPSQSGNTLTVFNSDASVKLAELPYSSAHGIISSFRYVFVTGISDATIGVFDRGRNKFIGEVSTDFPIPHNIAVNRIGSVLLVSHSGSNATRVSFYNINRSGQLVKLTDYESGLNPFGVLSY